MQEEVDGYPRGSISLPISISIRCGLLVSNRLLVSLEIKVDEEAEITCKETTSK